MPCEPLGVARREELWTLPLIEPEGEQLGQDGEQGKAAAIAAVELHESRQGRDWPAIPGHFGPPWFLPAVGLYYSLKDKLA